MDDFCGSKFWDTNKTWHSDNPDLTTCFQQTILVWVPCILLWIFSLLEIYYIRKSASKNVPWSLTVISKSILTVMLIMLTIIDLGMALSKQKDEKIYSVHIYTPVVKIATFVLAATLMYLNKLHGLRTSGLLFLFWFLLLIFSIPRLRTEIMASRDRSENDTESSWEKYQYVSFVIFFVSTGIIWFINCFSDREPKVSLYNQVENPCPELGASFLSRLFFGWFDALAWKGYRKPLETTDLWEMKPEDASAQVYPLFEKYWSKSVQKSNVIIAAKAQYEKDETSIKFSQPKHKSTASIVPALCKAFGPTFLFGALLKLIQDLLAFVPPQILGLLINFVDSEDPLWKGLLYAITLFVVAAVQTLVLSQYFNRMFIVGLRIRTALVSAIYRKALVMSLSARKESTVGEIVNLMSVDAQRFMDLTAYINMLWSAPLQIALALYFLWNVLGPSVLSGLAVMIILIPINAFLANKIKTLQIKQMKNKDERVKQMNEILNGVKVLKLYAWELSFEAQVSKIRDKEIKVLRQQAFLNAGTSFIWASAPFLVALVTFATYVLIDSNNVLDANTAFVSLSLFNILRFPLAMLPNLISNLVQTSVSVNRLNKYMNSEELDANNVQHDPSAKYPLTVENGSFSWDGEEIILKNINMKIEKNSLVAVVGSVGAGKSSLMAALLGELSKVSGKVSTSGSIAYVSQQAWIQNATLQDNITFGNAFNVDYYNRVIDACALKPDIDMLPGGDQTEIGEKGINLSGGQKQRVSLARSVYNNSDIYFFDDPLSAVDSHVGKHIFENVVGPNGMLANKTRIMVTHGLTYLPNVDHIYVIKDGEISESGRYQELLDKKGAFADFIIQHLQEVNADIEDLDELKQQLEATLPPELRTKLERALSRTKSENQADGDSLKEKLSRQNSSDNVTETSILHRRSSTKSNSSLKKETKQKNKLIEKEQSETGNVKWSVYKHYIQSIGVWLFIITIAFSLINQGFSIGSNFWLSKWSGDPTSGTDTSRRDMYLGVYGALGVGQAITNFITSLIMAFGCLYAAREMHTLLLTNVLRWSMDIFDTTPLGRILNRFSKDVDVVDNVLPMAIRSWMAMGFGVLATLVVISVSSPLFMAVIVPVAVIYYFVQRFYVASSRQLKRLESVSRSPIYSHFGESITGTTIIRAYGVQKRFINESEDKVDFNQVCYFPSIIANRWLAVRLEMVGNTLILFAALFAVLGRETINPGLVGLSVSYALQITQALNWLVRMTSDVETNIVAVERIKEYAEIKQEAPWEIKQINLSNSWPDVGRVEFRDVQCRYREGLDLVLKGISFVVDGGAKVGIVGRTGAGKSSLTLALFRIVELAGGTITIDGQDISKLGLHGLRGKLTIIPQDPVLFSGTLRLNLDPFNKFADEDVWKALEHAHLKSFVKGLSAGLSHEVNEGGENLSVGQRQLICLARALLRKTKVLILDEATAAVDLETDDLIQKTIKTEFSDCTVLTIAHRLNTILDSNKVLVLDKGEVVEYASPQKLLQNKQTMFYGMAKDAGLV